MLDREGFRPNVGIILLNGQNEVWWGKRVREHSWQFPQGGIKYGETPEQAMFRELEEEVGLRSEHVKIIGRTRDWRLMHAADDARFVDIEVQPVLWANHTDTLMHAALDGAGITATTIELAAPLIQNGDLVRVLNPWITDRLTMYAALPSRKFMPRRTEVFLDYLIEKTRARVDSAMATCSS